MANELTGKAKELANSGKYKEAVKLLNSKEVSDKEDPSALLLLLLCSYQVNTVEPEFFEGILQDLPARVLSLTSSRSSFRAKRMTLWLT